MARTARSAAAPRIIAIRRPRAALLLGTALQAAALFVVALPALAQPAPNARPSGGTIVAGQASISATASNTRIDQTSARAGIDWKGFDVGSQQSVTFNQPGASSITLNRVVSATPSQIAGRISANGQIVLMNQSGVIFTRGAQVDAQSVVVSAASMSNTALAAVVAGDQSRLVFDLAARPGAKVANAGTITVKQAGLAALVAPQVENSGTINATMGHVVLAGAEAQTIDLYGDGLLSLDITKQVSTTPTGPDGKPVTSLVTNSGTIIADGGTVLLTAAAADGIVQTLVTAGGRVRTDTVGGQAGTIEIAGTGGSVRVEGSLSAVGKDTGSTGGQIGVNATSQVTIAAGARINASGKAGGGVVAIGTTLARAAGGPSVSAPAAQLTVIEAGAKVHADATASGTGGRVTVLSTDHTYHLGSIFARGGPAGGDGGFVEVSGDLGFTLTGKIDVSAPLGTMGTILLDPANLSVTHGADGGGFGGTIGVGDPTATITDGTLNAFAGNILLQAKNNITTDAASVIALNNNNQSLTFQGGKTITLNGTIALSGTNQALTVQAGDSVVVNNTLSATGTVLLAASVNLGAGFASPVTTGAVTIGASVTTSGNMELDAGTGGIAINAGGGLGGATITLNATGGGVTENSASAITATLLQSSTTMSGTVDLRGSGNAIQNLGPLAVTGGGDLKLSTTGTLTIGPAAGTSAVSAGNITIGADTIIVNDTLNFGGGTTRLAAGAGGITINATGKINAATVDLTTTGGGITENASGQVVASTALVSNGGVSGTASLGGKNNVTAIGAFQVTGGDLTLANTGALTVGPGGGGTPVSGGNVTISSDSITVADALSANTALRLNAGTGGITINATGSLAAGTVDLNATGGGVSQNVNSTITANTLKSSATVTGDVTLLGSNNAVKAIANFAVGSGGFALVDQQGLLTVSGTVSGTSVALREADAAGIKVTGSIIGGARATLVADVLDLAANSVQAVDAGAVVELAPNANIDVRFANSGAGLLVTDTVLAGIKALSAGTLRVGAFTDLVSGSTTTTAQNITVAKATDLSALAGTLRLGAKGDVTQSAALKVGTLSGSVGGALTLGDPGNAIDRIGNLAVTGNANLTDANTLDVTGLFQAADLSITDNATGGITVTGGIAGTGTVTLNAGAATNGDVIATAGTISAGVLAGTIKGALTATNAANAIDGIGALAVTGDASITTQDVATISGPVTAANLTLTGRGSGGFAVTGTVSTGTLIINTDGGDVTESGAGAVAANALSGSITGAFSLANLIAGSPSNAIVQIGAGGLTATGDLSLSSNATLDVLNAVKGANVTLSDSGVGIAVDANVTSADGGRVSLIANAFAVAGVTIGGKNGTVEVAPLTQDYAVNFVNALSFTQLDIDSTLINALDTSTATLRIGRANGATTAGTIGFSQALSLTGKAAALELFATGAITQGGNVITVDTLGGSGASVSLSSALNRVNKLGDFSATGGTFAFFDNQALSVVGNVISTVKASVSAAGALSVPGAVTGGDVALSGSSVDIAGAVSGATVTLGSSSTITSPGTLTATKLTGNSINATTLTGTNAVTNLGDFTADGFTLVNGGDLSVTGTVAGGSAITLTTQAGLIKVPGSLSATTVALDANTTLDITGTVSGTTVGLVAGTTITESGVLVAGTLTGSSINSTSLTGATPTSNVVTNLGDFTADGFTLVNAGALLVPGTVAGGGFVSLASTNASLGITGSISATTIGLAAGTTISETGVLTATTLNVTSGGATSLTGATPTSNAVTNIGDVTAGGFTFVNGGDLLVVGTVAGGASASITSTNGSVGVPGSLSATAVDLIAGTTIDETGTLTATLLTGNSTGATTLTGTNAVSGLGAFTAGGFTLVTAGKLTVSGPVQGNSAASITSSDNALDITGSVSATTIGLTAGTTITETGVLTATTLNVNAGGAATLNGATPTSNAVTRIGDVTADGFTFVNGGDLLVTGTVNGGSSATITSTKGSLGVPGSVAATAVGLAAGTALDLAGTVAGTTVNLAAITTINEGGSLTAGTLTGGSGGATNLSGATPTANAVTRLGDFTANGFTLVNGGDLSVTGAVDGTSSAAITSTGGKLGVSGSVTATDVALNAGTALDLPGTVSGTTVNLVAGTTITQAGILIAGTLTGSSGGATSLTGATPTSNVVTNLGDFTAGGFTLVNGGDLLVTGAVDGNASAAITSTSGKLGVSGSVTATAVGLNAGTALDLPGTVSGTTVNLIAGTTITQAGILIAGTLTGSSTSTTSLTGATPTSNVVTSLGDFTAGGFTLVNGGDLLVTGTVGGNASASITSSSGKLGVSGSVTATAVGLNAGTALDLPGTVSGTTVNLVAGTKITEAGILVAGTLTGSSGTTTSLTGATPTSNVVTSLGDFTADGFTLVNGGDLLVTGTVVGNASAAITSTSGKLGVSGSVTATAVGLNAGTALDLPGTVSGTTVNLVAGTKITEAGILIAGTLTGSSGSSTSLTGATTTSNSVTNLGDFTANGFTLVNRGALLVTGAVGGGSAASITSTNGSLGVPGSVTATAVALAAGTALDLPGTVSGTTVNLVAGTKITEAGILVAGTLTGSSGTTTNLSGATPTSNVVTSLGDFTADGFTLVDGGDLSVIGAVAGASSASVTSTGGKLGVSGSVTATDVALAAGTALDLPGTVSGTTVNLVAGTKITEAGILIAGTLTGSSTNSTSLTGATPTSNVVTNLGDFTADGFTLVNAGALLVPGTVTGGGFVSLTSTNASLGITGSLSATTIGLTAGTTIAETGILAATTLNAQSGGATSLTGATPTSNAVTKIGDVTADGFTFVNGGDLLVSGTVLAGPSANITSTKGSLGIPGSLTATTVTLTAGTTITETGTLVAGTLTGSSKGDASFTGATPTTNQIAVLGDFSAAAFTLFDGSDLTLTGTLTAAPITLVTAGALKLGGTITGGDISLTAATDLTQTAGLISGATVTLLAPGTIGQTGGEIDATTLVGPNPTTTPVSATTVDLGNGGVLKATSIGDITASGDITLTDATAATVAGTLTAANVTLTGTDAAGLRITGVIDSPGLVTLNTTLGDLAEASGGTIIGGGTLAGSVAGAATLNTKSGTGNQIATIGDFAAVGDALIADAAPVTVAGTLTAANVTLSNSSAGGIAIAGAIASPGTVTFTTPAGGVSETDTGTITAAVLSGDIEGSANLANAANAIATISGLIVTGDATIADASGVTVTGRLVAANVALTDSNAAGINITGTVRGLGTVALAATAADAAINEFSTGVISAGLLTGAAGAAFLDGPNKVGTLGAFTRPGGTEMSAFRLANAQDLTVAGTVSAASVALNVTGNLFLTGGAAIASSGTTSLVASGAITQPGGFIATNLLTGSAASVSLGQANQIAVLGGFFAAGDFALNDATGLTLAGPLNAGTARLQVAGDLALAGDVNATSLALNAGGAITQTAGTLALTTLSGGAASAAFTQPNRIATLAGFTTGAGALTLTDAAPLTITGPVVAGALTLNTGSTLTLAGDVSASTLTVNAAATISRTAGALVVGTLTGSAVELADFGTGAQVSVLGRFSVTGSNLALANAIPLIIDGPLSAQFIRISAAGSMILQGDIATLGAPLADQKGTQPAPTGSWLAVTAPDGSIGVFQQLGQVTLTSLNGPNGALRIQLPTAGGSVSFANLSAPDVDVVLGLGSGRATGSLVVHSLTVVGNGGSADLTGTVAGVSGQTAAQVAIIDPTRSSNYRVNSCPIQSINCVLLPIATVPAGNPLQDIAVVTGREQLNDPDIVLPNVSDQDY